MHSCVGASSFRLKTQQTRVVRNPPQRQVLGACIFKVNFIVFFYNGGRLRLKVLQIRFALRIGVNTPKIEAVWKLHDFLSVFRSVRSILNKALDYGTFEI